MIVFVNAVEEEDDRNAFARVVEMVAAIEEAIRILGIVVTRVKRQVQVRLVDRVYDLAEFGAHHRRADEIDRVGPGELRVTWIRVADFLAAADHVHVDLGDDLVQRYCRILREVTRTPQTFLLTAMPNEQDRSLWTRRRLREGFGHSQQRGRTRSVVVSAVADR